MPSKTDEYFRRVMDKPDFALKMRRFINASLILYLQSDSDNYKQEIEDGYYYLTDFLENLDPYLEKK